jgi:sec-independent protein translocase protein TatA
MGELSPWHLLIVAVVFLVLFGSKKLPDAARSFGRSMRIFKAETKGLISDEEEERPAGSTTPTSQTSQADQARERAVQLREEADRLEREAAAKPQLPTGQSDAVTLNGVPLSKTEHRAS